MTAQAQFRLDIDRCTGCCACVVACENENDVGEGLSWRGIQTFNEQRHPNAGVFHFSMACNHCQEPGCMHGCPANAYTKDPETGVVLLDDEHCIGCRYCTWVCPYGAPQFNPSTGVMEKCTFCSHRLAQDLEPACVVACPVDALGFSERAETHTLQIPGFPEVGIGPSLRVEGCRWQEGPPEMIQGALLTPPLPTRNAPGLSLRSEWPLLLLTWAASILVAWFTSSIVSGELPGPWPFATLGVLAVAASTIHLGHPERAWRVILNLRRSWVSREIVLFSAFLGLAIAHGLVMPLPEPLLVLTGLVGFAALFAADKIYDIPGQASPAIPHSAMTTLTAAYLLGLLVREPSIALTAGFLKIVLYALSQARGETIPVLWAVLRILLGFLWPLVVWLGFPAVTAPVLLIGPVLGELIDRARFYLGRRFLRPQRQIDFDLSRMAARAPTK